MDKYEVLPFKKLIDRKKMEYLKATSFSEKENLAEKLFFIPEISKNFLDEIIKKYNIEEKSLLSSKEMKYFYDKFNLHQFSLSNNQNSHYYKTYFLSKNGKDIKTKIHLKYLATNNPMLNFKKIIDFFLELDENETDQNKALSKINDIDNSLSEMFKVYNIDFNDKTYFPPMKEYINYSYNYFTRVLLTVLIKFKKQRKIFNTNKKIDNEEYINFSTINGKLFTYANIKAYFEDFKNLIENLNEKEHEKNIKIIKIMLFYLNCLEMTRNYSSIQTSEKKIVLSMNSSPINNQILEKYNIFKANSNKKIEKDDWNLIDFDETVMVEVNQFNKISCKIKHFNTKLLELNRWDIINKLENRDINYLNMEGFLKNNFIQFEPEVEEYLKNFLINLFSSDLFIKNFLKYDLRFKNNKNKNRIMENIFKGQYRKEIFDELYNNMLFIPFPFSMKISGFSNRGYYTTSINSLPEIGENKNPLIIIPHIHYSLNDIYHEISHNIFLLIAANLDSLEYETINYTDTNNELIGLQKKCLTLYNVEYQIINIFSDFGDLMEISLYGIKPSTFKTYSSLFFLDNNSLKYSIDDLRASYIKFYNYKNAIKNEDIIKYTENNTLNNNKENFEILNLFSSNFWKILSKYFPLKDEIRNEAITNTNRTRFIDGINNIEISGPRNKCLIERKKDSFDINFFLK